MQLFYTSVNTPFKRPFTISGGRTKTHQPALIVGLSLGSLTGWGEAPAISYYNISVEKMIEDLEAKRKLVEKFSLTEAERYWHYLHHLFPKNPFLVCALDMAAWDLLAKMSDKPLYRLLDTEWENIPPTDYTIGINSIEEMIANMKANPAPVYKIKLGTEEDIATIHSLRQHTSAAFRVDINEGWEVEEALEKIALLKQAGVEFVEQPLAKDNREGMKVLHEKSVLPLFADESCVFEKDVDECAGHFHGINIKLTKCGGITPAVKMIKRARELGLKVMGGSMNETSIGTAAIANLLPQLDFVDMDGPLLLAEGYAEGLTFKEGYASLNGEAGLGIEVRVEKFKQSMISN